MVEYEYSDLYKQDSVDKQLIIEYDGGTITNELLHQENFSLQESLCSEDELTFGCCEASVVKFRVSSLAASIKGKQITIKETLAGNTDTPFQFGVYKVDTEKLTADRSWRDVTAYDAMYDIINADVADWYNEILPTDDSTCTMKEFRDSFIAYFGLEAEEIELVNDDMTIEKTITVTASSEDGESTIGEAISGKDVITAICEINGCFGHINREGKFQFIYLEQFIQGLYPAEDLYPDNAPDYLPYQQDTGHLYPQNPKASESGKLTRNIYITCTYEDFLTKQITKLQIRQEENDIGAIIGDGDNVYIIEGNFLVYGKSSDDLTTIGNNVFEKIQGILYRPYECEAKGNPCLEVGDVIRLNTKSEIIEAFIFERTLKGIQALRDTYTAEGVEELSEDVNSVSTQLNKLTGKSNTLSRTIEETQSTIVNVKDNLQSQITQNAKEITLKVSKNGVISAINQTAESVTIDASKINLNGAITANGNVTIGTDGKITAIGGTFTGGSLLSSSSSEYVKIANGAATGGYVSSSGSYSSTGKLDFGTKLDGSGAMAIRADNLIFCAGTLAVGEERNATTYNTATQNFDFSVLTAIDVDTTNKSVSFGFANLEVRNGMVCNTSFPWTTSRTVKITFDCTISSS